MKKAKNPHHGSSFESWLREEGIYAQVNAVAIQRVLAWQINQAMNAQHLSKAELARRMETSRPQLDRLLDPDNPSVTLDTLRKAARAVGRELRVELV